MRDLPFAFGEVLPPNNVLASRYFFHIRRHYTKTAHISCTPYENVFENEKGELWVKWLNIHKTQVRVPALVGALCDQGQDNNRGAMHVRL